MAAAVKHNKPVLCVYLEDVELDATLSMQTEEQQALYIDKYKNEEVFINELKKTARSKSRGYYMNNMHVSEPLV